MMLAWPHLCDGCSKRPPLVKVLDATRYLCWECARKEKIYGPGTDD